MRRANEPASIEPHLDLSRELLAFDLQRFGELVKERWCLLGRHRRRKGEKFRAADRTTIVLLQ